MLKSEELKRIQNEFDAACDRVWDDIHQMDDPNSEKYRIARKAHSHLLNAYLELMDAIDLIEELEDRE